ncbi:phosphoesterase [Alkalihalobacillus alcalophilus ATCC 27647 = CGMCC 1.3604]|uniref:Phosphoesterase n=2 Tax=Alkalihalobacillus alcalophilus TaxID=1445 RepID=A0A4S4JTA9_ALKAL|nr:phosphoesterase [Alkalihalobacillus alcalophilus ATCC 27647 = CGMCC 1.3604]
MEMPTYLILILSLTFYLTTCCYIAYNGWRWLQAAFSFKYKKSYIAVISFLSFAFFLSYFIPSVVLELAGGYWFIIVGYGLILLPLANIIYFVSKRRWKVQIGYIISAFFLFIFIYGSYNAWSPIVREYDISINKPLMTEENELKVLIASDLHMNDIIGANHIQRLVSISKEEEPDMILLPGDIIDDNITPYIEQGLSDVMLQLRAPYGVYAVPGNHDYYGGHLLQLRAELEEINIPLLMDETIMTKNGIMIVGREDFTNTERLTIEELMADVPPEYPVIMLDHQPREISEAAEHGVDLIVSGHTHRGQVFPANIITGLLFENDWGHLQIGEFHSFTTSGFGFWGPAVRFGTRAEVMIVNITFSEE